MNRPLPDVRGVRRVAGDAAETLVVLVLAARVEVAVQRTRRRVPAALHLTVTQVCRRLGVRVSFDESAAGPAPDGAAVLPGWARPRVRAVDRVFRRWPPGDTCLRRALVLGRRLAAVGPVLRIGPRRTPDGELVGHAWLEVGGRPVGEPGEGHLVVRRS